MYMTTLKIQIVLTVFVCPPLVNLLISENAWQACMMEKHIHYNLL